MRYASNVAVLLVVLCACGSNEAIPRSDNSQLPADNSQVPADNSQVPGASAATSGTGGGSLPGNPATEDIQRSTRSSLQWKRYATFENDLTRALDLPPGELCNEFGTSPCIRGVHLGPLGGHDVRTGLLESPPEPLVTTPSVVERVVLSACLARVNKDRAETTAVFGGVDLKASAPSPASDQNKALVTSFIRRFLARDPSGEELDVLGTLATGPGGDARPASVFATSVCVALGSMTEFLFF
jgi:hypothetical protein